jgi:secreted PhoX family phosphatase
VQSILIIDCKEIGMEISRRNLLKTASASGLVAAGLVASEGVSRPLPAQTEITHDFTQKLAQSSTAPTQSGEMTYRTLGRTGEKVSVIGLGGFHIGQIKEE